MSHLKTNHYFLVLGLICLSALFSCRKKDNRHEGNYIGTERHTYLDSGATSYSLDTSYAQEIQVTYSNAVLPRRKHYDFTHTAGNHPPSSVSKKSIVDGVYVPWNSSTYMEFSGDSMYLYYTNFNDQFENWDTETWEFRGKRN
jgi:hypothetical protein